MGSTDSLSSYSLLKMKMKEIENSKKIESKKENQESEQNSNKIKPSLPSDQKNDVVDPDIPDLSYGDFYCTICESHMNSQRMWNSHIAGKKHQKNVKKSVPDTKYKDLNVESCLKYELRNVKDAVIGLSYIQEIRRKEPGVPPFFTCFLCSVNCGTVAMVIEHVISYKHRLNYIKENSREDHELLEATNLKKGQMEPLVAETAHKLQEKFGSGSVKVKQEKGKPSSCPSKKPVTDWDDDLDDNDDDDFRMDRIKKPLKRNPFVWKAVDHHKRDNLKDIKDCRDIIQERRKRAYISDEEEDTYLRKNPVKRPSYSHSKRQRSISPYFEESSKMERPHSRRSNRSSSGDRYDYSKSSRSTYSCSLPEELLKKNEHTQRKSTDSPPYEHSHSRTQIAQKESSSNNQSLPNEPNNMESDSRTDSVKDFASIFLALPPEPFLKLVCWKLGTLQTLGIEQLHLLSQIVSKAQDIIFDKLPPNIAAVVRQKMYLNVNSPQIAPTSPATNPVAKSSTEINNSAGSSFSFIRSLIDQAKAGSAPSVTPIESHHSSMSYAASSHGNNPTYHQTSYVPPSNESQTFSIPGLTLAEDNRQTYAPSLNAYQSQYSNASSQYYPQYQY